MHFGTPVNSSGISIWILPEVVYATAGATILNEFINTVKVTADVRAIYELKLIVKTMLTGVIAGKS